MTNRKSEAGKRHVAAKPASRRRAPAKTALAKAPPAQAGPAIDTNAVLVDALHAALRSIDRMTAALPTQPAAFAEAGLAPSAMRFAMPQLERSGSQWCKRFPTSTSLDDLADPFRADASRFVAALRKAGATVSIAATYRPVERAWLMHWCFDISHNQRDPRRVPAMPGVPIDWVHVDAAGAFDAVASRRAAEDMADTYEIAFMPALESRHTQRRAVDMSISWSGTLRITGADGTLHAIGAPHDGSNPELQAVGRGYGVVKLVKDPPHWSDDGH